MADEIMANGAAFDPLASYARLSERVENQGRDIVDLRSNMNTGFRNIEGAVNALANEFRGSSKTQWPVIWSAIGVSFVVLAAVGSQALGPIKETQSDTRDALMAISDKMVTQRELEWRTDRSSEDRQRQNDDLANLRNIVVFRNEWTERNLSRDHETESVRADAVRDIANLQRQIDQQRSDFQTFSNSLGNGRDFILDLKAEQSRLRDQVTALTAKVAQDQPPNQISH